MDFKTGKLHKVIKEFEKGNGSYEINGVDLKNTVFLYREKASPFVPIPKGNYRTVFNENENTLVVDESINNKAIEFQVISVFDIQSSKYLEKFPELKMLVDHTNKMVDDINNIIEYLNSVGIKSDSKFQTQILTPLEPSSTWYMNADGIIDTLPIDDFNKKFKEIIEKISETVDKKAIEQVQEKLELLKSQIETFKSAKITEITENISAEKIKSLKEIDNKISIANNNFSEIFNVIDTKKYNSIREINEVKDSSKRELDSRMPEINNKFNSIAGGQLNPSFIQDVGEKGTGQFYLDRNTGRLHKCIKSTSSNINSTEYFEDVSISSIMNKLENLFNVKTYSYHNTEDVNSDMYIHYTVLKIMNICILEIKFSRVANKDVIVPATPLPVEFRPKSTEYLSAVAATGGIKMDYHWLRLEPNGNFYTHNNAGITVRNLQTTIAYIVNP